MHVESGGLDDEAPAMFRSALQRVHSLIRQAMTSRVVFLITCLTFSCHIWMLSKSEETLYNDPTTQEVIDIVAQDYRYASSYRKPDKLPKNLKVILVWNGGDLAPINNLGKAQNKFIKNNCSVIDCYVTGDRHFFGSDISRFHAIAFNGRNMDANDLPTKRYPHQKYIFFNMESSENFPVCNQVFDGFFNWTSTYKTDSDIPYTYIIIKNATGEVVGPKANMHWDKVEFINDTEEEYISNLWQKKTKAAAWFVSHCNSLSGRREFVDQLQDALKDYGWTVDIYGGCGPFKCPRSSHKQCVELLEWDYFFYMSLENSFAEDYVTEKLLTALWNSVIPIVYGGANYSRFLPPTSYLNGRHFTPQALAKTMDHFIKSRREYAQFFKWRSHYTYHNPSTVENVCAVCAALNDRTKFETVTTYHNFREWWNPKYGYRCS